MIHKELPVMVCSPVRTAYPPQREASIIQRLLRGRFFCDLSLIPSCILLHITAYTCAIVSRMRRIAFGCYVWGMRVLIACEESQAVCKAFRELGHEAYSCDLQACSGGHPEWHIQDDVSLFLSDGWDLMIAHPPCTFLSRIGMQHKSRSPEVK